MIINSGICFLSGAKHMEDIQLNYIQANLSKNGWKYLGANDFGARFEINIPKTPQEDSEKETLTKSILKCDLELKKFADGELCIQIPNPLPIIAEKHIVIFQSLSSPVNDKLMELLLAIEAFRNVGCRRISLVITYLGYARQDRFFAGQPNSIALISRLIKEAAGHALDQITFYDVHNESALSVFSGHKVENVVFVYTLSEEEKKNAVIVAPDAGAVKRAKKIADANNLELVIAHKHRKAAGVSEVLGLIGDVRGRNAYIVDDIVDSGGTLCNCADLLVKDGGAASVSAIVTHGVLSGNALVNLNQSVLKNLIISNSIAQPEAVKNHPKIKIIGLI